MAILNALSTFFIAVLTNFSHPSSERLSLALFPSCLLEFYWLPRCKAGIMPLGLQLRAEDRVEIKHTYLPLYLLFKHSNFISTFLVTL